MITEQATKPKNRFFVRLKAPLRLSQHAFARFRLVISPSNCPLELHFRYQDPNLITKLGLRHQPRSWLNFQPDSEDAQPYDSETHSRNLMVALPLHPYRLFEHFSLLRLLSTLLQILCCSEWQINPIFVLSIR